MNVIDWQGTEICCRVAHIARGVRIKNELALLLVTCVQLVHITTDTVRISNIGNKRLLWLYALGNPCVDAPMVIKHILQQ